MGKTQEALFDPAALSEMAGSVSLGDESRSESLAEAVDSLPEPYRSIIEWLYWEACSLEWVSLRLGYKHRSSAMRARDRALRMLRERLSGGCDD